MGFKSAKVLSSDRELLDAVERRVQDEPFKTYSKEERDILSSKIIRNFRIQKSPPVLGGDFISSMPMNDFWKDAKLWSNYLSEKNRSIDRSIDYAGKENFALLTNIQKLVNGLNADLLELEIQNFYHDDFVHYNHWSRPEDEALSKADNRWTVDYKLGSRLISDYYITPVPSVGLTLPVVNKRLVPLVDVQIVSDETDWGDSRQPMVSSSPRNLVLDNKVFRHVLVRHEHDSSARVFKLTKNYLTLLFDLGSLQTFNQITIVPAAQGTVVVENISYLNEYKEEVDLSAIDLSADTNLSLLVDSTRARYVKLQFTQSIPVNKGLFTNKNQRNAELNQVLKDLGFELQLNEGEESIEGRVYDFSIESVRFELNTYNELGIYRNKDIKVENLVGLSFSSTVEEVSSNEQKFEFYLGAKLVDINGSLLVDELLPLPTHGTSLQTEFIPLNGSVGRAKFFPDLLKNITKTQLSSIVVTAGPTSGSGVMTIVTAGPHGLSIGDSIGVGGSTILPAVDVYTVSNVVSTTEFEINQNIINTDLEVPEDYAASLYVYKRTAPPFTISVNGEFKTVGTDYVYSLDNGVNWYSDFTLDIQRQKQISKARSGTFLIKVLNPVNFNDYVVSYTTLPNQLVGSAGRFKLSNNSLVMVDDVNNTAILNTVILTRAVNSNQFSTSLLKDYTLRLQTNVI